MNTEELRRKVTIYSTNTCAYCTMVKKFLTMKGVEYNEVNLDERPDQRTAAYNLSGASTVPITHIVDPSGSSVVVGWNVGKLAAAIA